MAPLHPRRVPMLAALTLPLATVLIKHAFADRGQDLYETMKRQKLPPRRFSMSRTFMALFGNPRVGLEPLRGCYVAMGIRCGPQTSSTTTPLIKITAGETSSPKLPCHLACRRS